MVSDSSQIENHVIDYFSGLFSADDLQKDFSPVQSIIPRLVSNDHNNVLCRMLSLDEIKEVVFYLNPYSAPGLDGFIGLFLDIVGILWVIRFLM